MENIDYKKDENITVSSDAVLFDISYYKDEEYFKDMMKFVTEVAKKYGIKIPKIEIRRMKTRWGSCIPACNKVIFNLNLIKTPMCCIEYVVLHELSHFKHQNHSKNFYNFITIFMPDWKERKKILDEEFMGVV